MEAHRHVIENRNENKRFSYTLGRLKLLDFPKSKLKVLLLFANVLEMKSLKLHFEVIKINYYLPTIYYLFI